MKNLSILIPIYNDVCTTLVNTLCQQAEALPISYEIIVADDGSTHLDCVEANRAVNRMPHSRVIERPVNSGRAAIRNFLAEQSRYEWLLFIDGDMTVCRNDYLRRYAETDADSHSADNAVFDGGITVGRVKAGNLRSLYEKASEQSFTAQRRQRSPYHDFHTANFLVRRDIMLQHPFDLRFRHYGYEDVLFGKEMERHRVGLCHIDNPLSFERFESNSHFVSKTEEGLRTLHDFRADLQGYSRMLSRVSAMPRPAVSLMRLWHRLFGAFERRMLCGTHPRLAVFHLYRLGYYLSL